MSGGRRRWDTGKYQIPSRPPSKHLITNIFSLHLVLNGLPLFTALSFSFSLVIVSTSRAKQMGNKKKTNIYGENPRKYLFVLHQPEVRLERWKWTFCHLQSLVIRSGGFTAGGS